MKFNKWPETELEYWTMIEELGGFSLGRSYYSIDGGIRNLSREMSKSNQDAYDLQKKLLAEIEEKFGVIPPEKCPNGKIYYWNWYHKIRDYERKVQAWIKKYERNICSSCPFSKGVDYMINHDGQIPCGLVNYAFYYLRTSYACRVIDNGRLTKEELYQKMLSEHGEKAVKLFKKRFIGLRASAILG